MLELCLSKNAKLCQLKDPLFGLAVLVGGIASPSLYVVMLAGDGITLATRVLPLLNLSFLMSPMRHTLAMIVLP